MALRSLPVVVLSLVLGILAADAGLPHSVGLVAALHAIALGVAARPWPALRVAAALGLAFSTGVVVLGLRLDEASAGAPALSLEATLEGRIAQLRSRRTSWAAELRDVVAVDGGVVVPDALSLRGLATAERHAPFERHLPGARVRARVRLRAPGALRNPGGRDSRPRLQRAGIAAVGSLVHPALHTVVREPPGHRRFLERARAQGASRLAAHGPGGALLAALAYGDSSKLPRECREALARLGLSHLLAVSGLHLVLVAGITYRVLAWSWVRAPAALVPVDPRRGAVCLAALVALGYAALTGFGLPVRRALVFFGVLAAATLGRRPQPRGQALSLAGGVLLAVEPAALFAPGAQLSLAASAALGWARPRPGPSPGQRSVSKALREVAASVLGTSAVAVAATAPLVAWHFGLASPLGWLANLVAVPFTAVVLLPLALGSALADSLGIPVDAPAGLAAGLLAAASWIASRTPTAENLVPPVWALVLAVACALAVLRTERVRLRVVWAAAGSLILSVAPPPSIEPQPPRVVFLDVGQGDATLIQGRTGAILIDAGAAVPHGFDAGRQVVVPALRALGVGRLDLVIASHADLDHRGGLTAVLGALAVDRLWVPPGGASDPALAALRAAAARRRVPVEERGLGDPETSFGDLRVETLWPPREALPHRSRNDASIVVRIRAGGGRRVLLPGDIGAAAESDLLARAVDPHAEVLKLAHHGSRTSTSMDFLAAVAPLFAVASAPHRSRFGMPHEAVRERLRARGVPLLWTGRDGAVLIGLEHGAPVRRWDEGRISSPAAGFWLGARWGALPSRRAMGLFDRLKLRRRSPPASEPPSPSPEAVDAPPAPSGAEAVGTAAAFAGHDAEVALAALETLVEDSELVWVASEAALARVRKAAVDRLSDPKALAGLARTAPDEGVRQRAVKRLGSPELLASLALSAQDVRVARAAAHKLDAAGDLAAVARGAAQRSVARHALERIREPALLKDVALTASDAVVAKAAVKRVTDQAILSEIAEAATDPQVRRVAVKRLRDQDSLAQVVLHEASSELRARAVERMTDQEALGRIATSGEHAEVRAAALRRLVDEHFLAEVAVRDPEPELRQTAIQRISEPGLLARVATDGIDAEVCHEAVRHLRDRNLLAEIAKSSGDSGPRRLALQRIRSPRLLADVAENAALGDVRALAVRRLKDRKRMAAIALSDEDPRVRRAAVVKIADQERLRAIARVDPDGRVRQAAVERIQHPEELREHARNDEAWQVREAAIKRVDDAALLANRAKWDKAWQVRKAALGRLDDQAVLANRAKNDEDWGVRLTAVERLTDAALLANRAQWDEDARVRRAAVCQLGDDAILARISERDPEESVRAAATERLAARSEPSGNLGDGEPSRESNGEPGRDGEPVERP